TESQYPTYCSLSLHDALPICHDLQTGRDVADLARAESRDTGHRRPEDADFERVGLLAGRHQALRLLLPQDPVDHLHVRDDALVGDRKSTRLNSSHVKISYAVF